MEGFPFFDIRVKLPLSQMNMGPILGFLCIASILGAGAGAAEAADKRTTSDQGHAEIEWVTVPGENFMMGLDDKAEQSGPRHRVSIKTFQISKTLVTNKQYKTCVSAGACTPAHASDGTCYVPTSHRSIPDASLDLGRLPVQFRGDDQPVVCVDWDQASAFAKWSGGRLLTEAEWEYAARNGGKEQEYPWGNDEPSCELLTTV